MLAAIKAAEDAVATVPDEPAMLDALSVVLNMGMLALGRDCLFNDPRMIAYPERALDVAQQIYDLQPRNREAKGVLAEMYSALGQTLVLSAELDDRVPQAREAFLNAYRLRVELADTDPSNQFFAAQVMKSRLDLQELRTHDPDPTPPSFIEREALTDLGSQKGRQHAKEAGLETLWLAVFAEKAVVVENNTVRALAYTRQLLRDFQPSALNEADLFISLSGNTLLRSLTQSTNDYVLTLATMTLPQGQDCRSRFTRRLWHAINGETDLAAAELKGIRERNVTYPAMEFYERLIAEMNGS